jgi:hypothetical protein
MEKNCFTEWEKWPFALVSDTLCRLDDMKSSHWGQLGFDTQNRKSLHSMNHRQTTINKKNKMFNPFAHSVFRLLTSRAHHISQIKSSK